MAGMQVPTVKIVNHKAKNGFIIINLSDFVVGVHTLWDDEKQQQKNKIVVTKPSPDVIRMEQEVEKVQETEEASEQEEVPEPEETVAETEVVPTESASPSASPSKSSEVKKTKRVYKRRGRKK